MINVSLTKYNWFEYRNEHFQVWGVGYVFFENIFYSNEKLSEFFASNFEKVDFKELLNKLSGNFAIIIKTNSKLLIISDIVRSYPLIYTIKNQTVQVYDCDITYKKENEDFEIDVQNLKQYVCSGLVFGNKTIYKQVFGIQAAESVLINLNTFKISTERYYLFLYKKNDNPEYKIDINKIAEKFDKILINIFERIIHSAPNVNNWIIPLSGGHDSRLIAYYFHKLGIKNVICYSYGRRDSIQGKISKKVANELGYKWKFIEVDDNLIKDIYDNNLIDKYINFTFLGTSTVGMQNFISIQGLKKKGIVADGDVFIPGHALDAIVGSKIYQSLIAVNSRNKIKQIITSRNNVWNFKSEYLHNELDTILDEYNSYGVETIEAIGWQERQSKYIVNTVRCYEMFDLEWRLPFWDKEIVTFFSEIPPEFLVERKLFFNLEQIIYNEKFKAIPFDSNYQLSFHEKCNKLSNFLYRKVLAIFGKNIPYLLDEAYNLVFAKNNEIVDDYINKTENEIKSLFDNKKNVKLNTLHINQIIILKILKNNSFK